MAAAKDGNWIALLSGDLTSIPKLPSKVVRIFLSSTFGDMTAERNAIIDELEPIIRQWCVNQGLEFQLVDMRWGIRDEATADHMTTIICLKEIAKCKELSLGPNFVFLLGQRYGYRPLPASIPSDEFGDVVAGIDDPSDQHLVEDWYCQDSNLVPAAHILQPIGRLGGDVWQKISGRLEGILRGEADKLYKAQKMPFKEWQKYFISVTEQEIRVALDVENPNDHCLGFIREITDLYDNFDDPSAKRFCNVKDDKFDEEAKRLLDEFKHGYVPSALSSSNLLQDQLRWSPNVGIDPHSIIHQKYLQGINSNFLNWVKIQVTRAKKQSSNFDFIKDPLIAEVIHHANFCASKCKSFRGCEGTLEQIFVRVLMAAVSKPIILHGVSGSGKTSMVAMVAKQAKESHGENINIVLRFLGTSPQSSSILHVLQSIVEQICKLYDLPLPAFNILDDYDSLILYFPSLLESVSTHLAQVPLLLILDSLDQLEDSHRAYKCKWLPRKCPKGVQILLSTLPDMFEILDRLKEIIVDDDRFVPIQPLSDGTGADILRHWMASINRKVSAEQNEVIKEAFSRCPQPLFLKLLFEDARRWKSYDVVEEEELASTVREAIGLLFQRLERQFGQKLVSHALGYVTAARNGLTQDELQHILSLDDEVLDEVYQYWPPPDPKEVALPPLIWARLRFELQEYMAERQANGRTVMTLYHRQFTEAAQERYLSTDSERKLRHQVIADFFSGKWANREKTLQLTLNSLTLNPYRMVQQQPLSFQTDHNRRKLHELPYHLTHAGPGALQDICKLVYGDFGFLQSYVAAFSAQLMIEEISSTLKVMPKGHRLRVQMELLRDTIRLAKPTIEFTGTKQSLSAEILGRLLGLVNRSEDTYSDCLKPLVHGAQEHCQNHPEPMLVPIRVSFPEPGGPLRTTLVGHEGNINKIHISSNCSMLASASADGTIRIWDLSTDETVYVLVCDTKSAMVDVHISSDNRWIVGLNTEGSVHIWGMNTGDLSYSLQTAAAESKHIGLFVTEDCKKIVHVMSGHIEVHNIVSGEPIFAVQPAEDVITCVDPGTSTDSFVTGAQSGSVWLWSLHDGSSMGHLVPDGSSDHGGVITMETCSQGGFHRMVFGTEQGYVVFAERSDVLEPFEAKKVCHTSRQGPCRALCINGDGTQAWAAVGSFVYCFHLNGESTEAVYILKGYRTDILSLTISHDDRYLIAGQIDDVMMVWLLDVMDPSPKALHPLEGLNADVWHLAYAHVGSHQNMVISASTNLPFIKLWDLQKVSDDPASHKTFFYKEGPLVVTSDSQFVVSMTSELSMEGSETYLLNVWDSLSGKTHQVCKSVQFAQCLAKTGNDMYLFYSAEEGVVSQYNLQTHEEICCLKGGAGRVCDIQVRVDDKYLLVLKHQSEDPAESQRHGRYFAELWHLSTRRHHSIKIELNGDEISCATLTEQNLVILAGDRRIMLCDSNGNQTQLKGDKEEVEDGVELLVLSQDEELLAAKTAMQKVHIWNLQKRQVLQTLDEVGDVLSMAFTGVGEYLVTGSADLIIRVWSVHDGHLYSSLYVYGAVVKLATNSDTIVAATENGHLMELALHSGSANKDIRRTSMESQRCAASTDRVVMVTGFEPSAKIGTVEE